ncbi:MAG: cytochrome b [Azoarcus sp.]|nr:cytochrome b [Azoarcus sp.]PKO58702.1 MAG: cytochrome b [Betaproteobacteria bacterium HGW-Betaproteobacteria-19]
MNNTYTRTAIALHWLIALCLIGSFALGTYMTDLSLSPRKLELYSWHKWAGVSIFLLVLIRLGWRLGHPPPPLPASMPAVLRAAAHFTHIALYVLMIAIPLSGWLMSSAKGVQTVWFGIVPLPDLLTKNADLGKQLESLHFLLNYTMAVLVFTHIGAALKHHFIDRDDILRRMLPGRRPG